MGTSQERALRNHRKRLKARGLKRLELRASEPDAALLRELARILREDSRRSEWLRRQLSVLAAERPAGLKALLAAAPLEGISITRSLDHGRTIEL